MSQRPGEWVLGRLDALLPVARRDAPAEERGRYRVLAGTALLLSGFGAALALSAPFFPGDALGMALLGGGVMAGLLPVLLALRRGVPLRPLSLWVCGLLSAGVLGANVLFAGVAIVASHVSIMLLPLLAVYLLGVRAGLGFTGLCCANAALLTPLLQGHASAHEASAAWVRGALDALALLLGWGVCALFSQAREAAVLAARESEGKLLSLLESTEDPICSMDGAGRIVTANAGARRMFLALFGRELRPGDSLAERSGIPHGEEWGQMLGGVLAGRSLRYAWSAPLDGAARVLDCSLHPVRGADGRAVGVTLFGRDITERKETEAKLEAMNRSLVEVSRQAGMAEVATGVLHNVGNTLNSINVSASLMVEWLRASRAPPLARAVGMLREHAATLPSFLTEDPRGRQLPDYLSSASQHLSRQHEALLEETKGLLRNVEHIRAVVGMQQQLARRGGQVEALQVPELIDDALRLYVNAFERQGIHIHREYTQGPPVWLDRHRLLQIVVNLLNNARQALVESGREDKRLSIRVWREGETWLHIEVGDNGVGIAPEHLPSLFTHGFTTKKDGHGFGLHASAMAAEAMNGHLRCDSDGRGQGARFRIELPLGQRLVGS